MNKVYASLVLFALLALGAALPLQAAENMPGPDPAALWEYITKTSPYPQWKMWPDHEGMQPGRAPHGPLHKVYVNDILLESKKTPVPYGSIEVKENYTPDNKVAAITVQYKIKDFNPPDGDWYWAKYSPDGQAQLFGKVAGCIGCHGTRAANDFILVHEFR